METVKCPHCKKEIELSEVTKEHAKNLATQLASREVNKLKDMHKKSLQKEKEKGKKEAEQELKNKFSEEQKTKDLEEKRQQDLEEIRIKEWEIKFDEELLNDDIQNENFISMVKNWDDSSTVKLRKKFAKDFSSISSSDQRRPN